MKTSMFNIANVSLIPGYVVYLTSLRWPYVSFQVEEYRWQFVPDFPAKMDLSRYHKHMKRFQKQFNYILYFRSYIPRNLQLNNLVHIV